MTVCDPHTPLPVRECRLHPEGPVRWAGNGSCPWCGDAGFITGDTSTMHDPHGHASRLGP